jgi:DNA repair protein RadC
MNRLSERVQYSGVGELSDADLLSLVLHPRAQSDKAVAKYRRLLVDYPHLQDLLQLDIGELTNDYHLGATNAARLQALLELARRLTIPTTADRYQITSAFDAAKLVFPMMAYLDHEEMRVLVLDIKNQVVANQLLYRGTIDTAVSRVAEIFRPAVTRKCPKILLCHNHPSGDVTPSPDDLLYTRKCVDAGNLLDIDLVDHLIIGPYRFTSLKEQMHW